MKAQYPDYFCRPVPAFGDPDPGLLIVGLAPGMHGANATGRPFTGDHAGDLTAPSGRVFRLPRVADLDALGSDATWGADPDGTWPTSRRRALARLRAEFGNAAVVHAELREALQSRLP